MKKMIAEPYICIKGPRAGTIEWFQSIDPRFVDSAGEYHHEGVRWRVYADFEREKLNKLSYKYSSNTDFGIGFNEWHGFTWMEYTSHELIAYTSGQYDMDSESNRLLKRAEFLSKVCDEEGVKWLSEKPKYKCDYGKIRTLKMKDNTEWIIKEFSEYWCHSKNPEKCDCPHIQKMRMAFEQTSAKEKTYVEYYEFQALSHLLESMQNKMDAMQEEEHRWRKALLNFLPDELRCWDGVTAKSTLAKIESLRKNFT